MKTKELALVLYVAVCTVLVVATVVIGVDEVRGSPESNAEQQFSASIGSTQPPMPAADLPEPTAPATPFDQPAPTPTHAGEDDIDT